MKSTSQKGLVNLGNTCFFNSTMQCLLSMEEFCNFFEEKDFDVDQPISRALQNFIKTYRKSQNMNVDPSTFVIEIKNKIRLFNGTQQDAHSFLELLLSLVFEENEPAKNEKSEIEKLFLTEHKDTITCKNCLHKEERKSKSAIQWLFIMSSVEESILTYEGVEDYVDEHSQWKCPKCNKKVSSGIKHKITNTSEYFVINLNRFLDTKNKNTRNINVNEIIEVNNIKYRINSFVCHTGNLNYGHYYSYGRRSDGTYKFNDTSVSTATLSQNSSGPYILFYEKFNKESI